MPWRAMDLSGLSVTREKQPLCPRPNEEEAIEHCDSMRRRS
jgi:hypothetical protein